MDRCAVRVPDPRGGAGRRWLRLGAVTLLALLLAPAAAGCREPEGKSAAPVASVTTAPAAPSTVPASPGTSSGLVLPPPDPNGSDSQIALPSSAPPTAEDAPKSPAAKAPAAQPRRPASFFQRFRRGVLFALIFLALIAGVWIGVYFLIRRAWPKPGARPTPVRTVPVLPRPVSGAVVRPGGAAPAPRSGAPAAPPVPGGPGLQAAQRASRHAAVLSDALGELSPKLTSVALRQQIDRLLAQPSADREELVQATIRFRDRLADTDPAAMAKLGKALAAVGVREVVVQGVAFDPRLHEAVETAPAPEPEKVGQVAETEECGYVDGDRVLRVPRVVVYR